MKPVAVTGASGLIGSAVVRELLRDGRPVRVLVEPGCDERNLAGLAVDRVVCDVVDQRGMERALSGCESLYHLAAVYKTWTLDPTSIYQVNVEGTTSTLLAAKRAKIKRVVYTSSIAAVGLVPGGLADETTAFNSFELANDYILSKWMSERVALQFVESGLSLVVVNPAFPFGPGDIAPTPTGKIILTVLRGEVPGILPGGLCAVDVDDCARGHLLAEEKGREGERYILGGENVGIRDLLDRIATIANVPMTRTPMPGALAAGVAFGMEMWANAVTKSEPRLTYRAAKYAMRNAFFSSEKAWRELGFRSRPLDETLRRAIDWFRASGSV